MCRRSPQRSRVAAAGAPRKEDGEFERHADEGVDKQCARTPARKWMPHRCERQQRTKDYCRRMSENGAGPRPTTGDVVGRIDTSRLGQREIFDRTNLIAEAALRAGILRNA